MKKMKLSHKTVLSLVLSAVLLCMPVAAFAMNEGNAISVQAEDLETEKTTSEQNVQDTENATEENVTEDVTEEVLDALLADAPDEPENGVEEAEEECDIQVGVCTTEDGLSIVGDLAHSGDETHVVAGEDEQEYRGKVPEILLGESLACQAFDKAVEGLKHPLHKVLQTMRNSLHPAGGKTQNDDEHQHRQTIHDQRVVHRNGMIAPKWNFGDDGGAHGEPLVVSFCQYHSSRKEGKHS